SHGYDHKAMGITARGTWLAVRQHFRQLGLDPDRDPLRVVGVGDMSGDVFGSGMLRSEALLLIGAFDGRHIFLDPAPDPKVAFAERERLAGLPASGWDDYDRSLISAGGGVWPRAAKSIPLSPQAGALIGLGAEHLSPPELICALLGAPVDLLFFGGVGTFVKAPGEADSEVGDPANDGVRVTADQVRARVIAEGANLAVTQRGRVRYSRHGGRVNTYFVDNSAGVATSDREVNLKILLALAMEEGRLDAAARNELLASLEVEVADAVLHQVEHSVTLLSWATPSSAAELDAYRALTERLRSAGLDPAAEALPDEEELDRRRAAGAGLTRPELAVLMAYTKNALAASVEASPLPSEPAVEKVVAEYFPAELRARFADLVPRHRLYPQLAATDVAGEVVDRLGIVWAHETAEELDRTPADSVAAFWAAYLVVGAGKLWKQLDAEGASWPADMEEKVDLRLRQSVAGLSRWYLVRPGPVVLGDLVNTDGALARRWLETSGDGASGAGLAERVELAARVALALPAAELLGEEGADTLGLDEVVAAGDRAERLVGLDQVRAALDARSPVGRWSSWQARALLDEVAQWRASLVPDLLAGRGAEWEERVGRCRLLAAEVGEDPAQVLVRAALVLRSLRRASLRPFRG
ncbi:MAG: NAD-glutamate dehydrogenase domain-containing protein, partial [Acidimicrobiales bacterium]